MAWIDLSHTIVSGMPQWRGDDQPLLLHRRSEHGPDSHMSSSLELGCHVGTHIDAPLHFLDGQPGLDQLPLERFSGPCLVVDCRGAGGDTADPGPLGAGLLDDEDLAAIDFVLFLTGWDRHWGRERYYREWPWLDAALARRLADAGLKGVGLDTPSLDEYSGHQAHDICAAAGLINIENLTGLDRLPRRGAWFQALPLKLEATEASPVRAVARVDGR
jgi:kynurenine formamidase